MARRSHVPWHPNDFRGFHDGPWPMMDPGPVPLPVHPAALEEELEVQRREIQRIVDKNQHVIDENSLLRKALTAAKDEIHKLGQLIPTLRAEKEAQKRILTERGLKLEAQFRATRHLRAEVVELRTEVQKLNASRQDLSSQVQGLTKDFNQLKAENQQLISMRTDIDVLHKELVEARRVYEHKKIANEELVEQKQAMETNLVFMAHEMEKFQAKRLNAEGKTEVPGLGAVRC